MCASRSVPVLRPGSNLNGKGEEGLRRRSELGLAAVATAVLSAVVVCVEVSSDRGRGTSSASVHSAAEILRLWRCLSCDGLVGQRPWC